MFDGLEIDMLSVGDADCIIVTAWSSAGASRILVDGGHASDYFAIREFLRSRDMRVFWSAVCTHPHADHAGGLIKLLRDPSFTFYTAWMHDIRNHVPSETLRRAARGNSQLGQVCEATTELASAFKCRGITPEEPFGARIAFWPSMTVLGPSIPFYKTVIEEFTGIKLTPPYNSPPRSSAFGTLPLPAVPVTSPSQPFSGINPLAGFLKNTSVEENPTTQPFNDTSVILGINFGGAKLLLTADAGSRALDRIHSDWHGLSWMQVPHHGSDGNLSKSNIERFCPNTAFISARGSTDHPSRAIVNGLIKVGAAVCSTHSLNPGHLHYWIGAVPSRPDYGPAVTLKGTSGRLTRVFSWPGLLPAQPLR